MLSKYFQNHFKLSQTVGGGIASVSGLLNLFSRPSGGVFSDALSARFGHRHRITWLFGTTLAAGICMILFGALPLGLAPATVLMVLFSIFYEQACGATYALVPFVSNRSPGLVSGFVSSGGTAGAALWNGVVFKSQAQVREDERSEGKRKRGNGGGGGGGRRAAPVDPTPAPPLRWGAEVPARTHTYTPSTGPGRTHTHTLDRPLPHPLSPPSPLPPTSLPFFCPTPFTQSNYKDLGIIISAVSATCLAIYWPAWGGMFIPPRPYATEDEYYASEWTPDERAAGLHQSALRFAHEASVHGGSQHGSRHGGRSGMGSRSQSKASLSALGKVSSPGDDSARGGKVAVDGGGVAKV